MLQIDWNALWEWGKNLLGVLAAAGVVIDLSPHIKIQPVRALIGWVGKQLNRDMQKELDKLAKDFESHKVDSWRSEILEFANSCMNRRKHTKEEFDHIISVHDDYAEYVKVNEIENGQVTLAYEYIEKLYQRCLEKNSFLVVRPDDEDGEE